jgi:hypothetical protein
MGHVAQMGERCIYCRRGNHFKDLGVDGKIILKLIIKKRSYFYYANPNRYTYFTLYLWHCGLHLKYGFNLATLFLINLIVCCTV